MSHVDPVATVIAPPPRPYLRVADRQAVFPVRRIYCVGRNYAEHAREMGHDPEREPPFFFQKSPGNLLIDGADLPWPGETDNLHPEVELVVALATGGSNIAAGEALDCIWGYAVGLDMTRRDLQSEAKKMGRPWESAKAFEHSAPCGTLVSAAVVGHPSSGAIILRVNGETRQSGDLEQMIWKVPETIAELSRLFTLAPGDLIMTGTPAGVGPVTPGDRLDATIAGLPPLSIGVLAG